MYTKDKSARITLRLNQEQFDFVKSNADMLGVSPSEFLRMVVNMSMSTAKATAKKMVEHKEVLKEIAEEAQEGLGRANDKTDINHLV